MNCHYLDLYWLKPYFYAGPGFESVISHNCPGGLQGHCLLK